LSIFLSRFSVQNGMFILARRYGNIAFFIPLWRLYNLSWIGGQLVFQPRPPMINYLGRQRVQKRVCKTDNQRQIKPATKPIRYKKSNGERDRNQQQPLDGF